MTADRSAEEIEQFTKSERGRCNHGHTLLTADSVAPVYRDTCKRAPNEIRSLRLLFVAMASHKQRPTRAWRGDRS